MDQSTIKMFKPIMIASLGEHNSVHDNESIIQKFNSIIVIVIILDNIV